MADQAAPDYKLLREPERAAPAMMGFTGSPAVAALERRSATLNASARVMSLRALGADLSARAPQAPLQRVMAPPPVSRARLPDLLPVVQRVVIVPDLSQYRSADTIPEAWAKAYRRDKPGLSLSLAEANIHVFTMIRKSGAIDDMKFPALGAAVTRTIAQTAPQARAAAGPNEEQKEPERASAAASSSASAATETIEDIKNELMQKYGYDEVHDVESTTRTSQNCHGLTFSSAAVEISTVEQFLREWEGHGKKDVLLCLTAEQEVAHSATHQSGYWRQKLEGFPVFSLTLEQTKKPYAQCYRLSNAAELSAAKKAGGERSTAFRDRIKAVETACLGALKGKLAHPDDKTREILRIFNQLKALPSAEGNEGVATNLIGQLQELDIAGLEDA